MAAKQTVQYTHKHANTSTRKTQKDKNSNQQSYQQTDETGCSGKAVGVVKGRETSGWVMQVDTIDYWLRQSSLQRLRHTKHDKSSETYTDNIKKTLKTYTTDAASVCHIDFLIEETELSNWLIPYLAATDRISCWQSLAIVLVKILLWYFNFL